MHLQDLEPKFSHPSQFPYVLKGETEQESWGEKIYNLIGINKEYTQSYLGAPQR